MIEVRSLSKRYGPTLAVDELSFAVRPGVVTGFVGPNGAGKSTTMRMILGLDHPTSGVALVNGRPYAETRNPMREVGALLDAKSVHGGRTARKHLRALARSNGLARERVEQVLELTGLSPVAGRRIRGFSLGMAQRLGIAAAMLGDPAVLIFDEPINGLDPEGIQWVRTLLRFLAGQGRTVLVSSHLMSEMALTADHLIVIGRGRLLADTPTRSFIAEHSPGRVRVRASDPQALARLLAADGHRTEPADGYLQVTDVSCDEVGQLAFAHRIAVHELFALQSSLEEAFMRMTGHSVEYAGTAPGQPFPAGAPPTSHQPPPPDGPRR